MDITVTELEIGFENVEGVKIPPKYVIDLRIWGMTDLRRMYRRNEELDGDNELGLWLKRKEAEVIVLIIDKAIEGKVLTNYDNEFWWRVIRYPDITDIKIKYSDGTEEEIGTNWEDVNDEGEENALQKHYFDNEGNLVIKIGKSGDE